MNFAPTTVKQTIAAIDRLKSDNKELLGSAMLYFADTRELRNAGLTIEEVVHILTTIVILRRTTL